MLIINDALLYILYILLTISEILFMREMAEKTDAP